MGLAFGLAMGCPAEDEGPLEKAGESIEEGAEEAGDAVEDAVE